MTAVSDAGDGGEAGVSEAGVRDAHHHPMAEAWKVAFAFAGLCAHRVHHRKGQGMRYARGRRMRRAQACTSPVNEYL